MPYSILQIATWFSKFALLLSMALNSWGRWNRETWHRETGQRGTRLNRSRLLEHPSAQEKNRTCWTISELNPVCHDSTAALIVACSFCVQSAILSALIRSTYSCGSTIAATATAARTKSRTSPGACASSANFRASESVTATSDDCCEVCIVAPRAGFALVCRADIEHVDSIQDDAMMTKKLLEIDVSVNHIITIL